MEEVSYPFPRNEQDRLMLLSELNLFRSDPNESKYDRYATIAARIFKVPVSLITLVGADRVWFKSKVGMSATEVSRRSALCTYAILESAASVSVVYDALKDDRFCNNNLVVGAPFIRFYAGASIQIDGVRVGTLCVIDYTPRTEETFSKNDQKCLEELAGLVSDQLNRLYEEHVARQKWRSDLHFYSSSVNTLQVPLRILEAKLKGLETLFDMVRDSAARGIRFNQVLVELQTTAQDFAASVVESDELLHAVIAICSKPNIGDSSKALTDCSLLPLLPSHQARHAVTRAPDHRVVRNDLLEKLVVPTMADAPLLTYTTLIQLVLLAVDQFSRLLSSKGDFCESSLEIIERSHNSLATDGYTKVLRLKLTFRQLFVSESSSLLPLNELLSALLSHYEGCSCSEEIIDDSLHHMTVLFPLYETPAIKSPPGERLETSSFHLNNVRRRSSYHLVDKQSSVLSATTQLTTPMSSIPDLNRSSESNFPPFQPPQSDGSVKSKNKKRLSCSTFSSFLYLVKKYTSKKVYCE